MKSIITRVTLLIMLLIAWYNPSIPIPKENDSVTILVDISESFSEKDRNEAFNKAKKIAGSSATISYFAGTQNNPINKGQTDLYTALSSVYSKTILLVSDGWENRSSVHELYPTLTQRGQKVYPVLPEKVSQGAHCGISLLSTPLSAARNVSVPIFVTVENQNETTCTGTLVVKHGEKIIDEQLVSLHSGEEKRVESKSDPKQEGLQEITATFTPKNDLPISTASRFLSVTEREKVLVISGAESDAKILKPILENQKFKVESILGSAATQIAKNDLLQYATVILNNVSIKQLSFEFLTSLKEVVSFGKGLITFGGERGYGLGGYRDSVIEEAMPLLSLPPQTEEKRLNVAVQLVIDKSQSMASESRLDFVKSAAREVINGLKPDDYVGVVAFDSQPFVVVPIGRIQDIRSTALSQIENIFPTGSTRLMRALQDAGRLVERVPAGRKHIIVLTDGRLPDAGPMYLELVKQLRISGVTLSSVLLSDDGGSYPLKEMSEIGGGLFYVTTDPSKLPRIFMEDIRVSTGERTMKEASQYRIKRGPSGIQSTTLNQFPLLKGYVQTKIKENASLELQIEGNGSLDPLLASWNFQKGKVISFTSDIYGRWSDEWTQWEKFPQFILDLVNMSSAALRQDESLRFDMKTLIDGDRLTLDLSVYSSLPSDQITGTITTPNGTIQNVNFSMRAKGSFQTELSSLQSGDYTISLKSNDKVFPTMKFNVSSDILGEKKNQGINLPLLSELSSVTGGEVDPKTLSSESLHETQNYSLQRWIILFLLFLFFIEIWIRERV